MTPRTSLIGIELVVDDLDRAVELFVDVLGATLVQRAASTLVVGEMAIIDANGLMVSLLQPAASGSGTVLAVREPRLSQFVLGTTGGDSDDVATCAMQAGLSVVPMSNGGFHLSPESVEGALGLPVAIVVAPVAAD